MLNQTARYYKELGYQCIPIRPNNKKPWGKEWQNRTVESLWKAAPAESIFGLRGGGGRAYIDCDNKKDPETFDMIVNWLDGLGYPRGSYPVVKSASGVGRHIYINQLTNMLGHYRNLKIGTGEFRYGHGAYVVAPPSIVEGRQYELIEGDITKLPTLELKDIEQLIKYPGESRVKHQQMTDTALRLMMGETPEGKSYPSRSEAEQALVLSLVNSGYEFSQIKKIFDEYPAFGKYLELKRENEQNATRYLTLTYDKARQYSEGEGNIRKKIREIKEAAEFFPFENITEKIVMFAHLTKAYKAGNFTYNVSSRELAVMAGIDRGAAETANKNLLLKGWVELKGRWKFEDRGLSNRYSLEGGTTFPHVLTLECVDMGGRCPQPAQVLQDGHILDLEELETADAFRNGKGKLGRRAGQIYKLLFIQPLDVKNIAKRINLSTKQVGRILKRLANVKDYKTGEVIQMVSKGGDNHWYSNIVDLELIEAIYNTRGARAKQALAYQMERERFNRFYKQGKDDQKGNE